MPELNAPDVLLLFPQLLCVGSSGLSRRAITAFHSKHHTSTEPQCCSLGSGQAMPDPDRTHLVCEHTGSSSIWSRSVCTGCVLWCIKKVSIRGWLRGPALAWHSSAQVVTPSTQLSDERWEDQKIPLDTITPVTLCWCPTVSTLNSQMQEVSYNHCIVDSVNEVIHFGRTWLDGCNTWPVPCASTMAPITLLWSPCWHLIHKHLMLLVPLLQVFASDHKVFLAKFGLNTCTLSCKKQGHTYVQSASSRTSELTQSMQWVTWGDLG